MPVHELRGESLTELTYADVSNQLNITVGDSDSYDISATEIEALMDQAINKIVRFGRGALSIPNMQGDDGSKTVSVDQATASAIIDVSVALYKRNFRSSGSQSESSTLGPASYSSSIQTSSTAPDDVAKEAAMYLREAEVSYG